MGRKSTKEKEHAERPVLAEGGTAGLGAGEGKSRARPARGAPGRGSAPMREGQDTAPVREGHLTCAGGEGHRTCAGGTSHLCGRGRTPHLCGRGVTGRAHLPAAPRPAGRAGAALRGGWRQHGLPAGHPAQLAARGALPALLRALPRRRGGRRQRRRPRGGAPGARRLQWSGRAALPGPRSPRRCAERPRPAGECGGGARL